MADARKADLLIPPLQLHGVSKRFRRGESVDSLRDVVARWWRPLRVRNHDDGRFFALRDISFHVEHGEAFGIIGPNGAGKSTILKLLAGILRPTSGTIHTRGRLSALIELGAGFHGDLTGRENIYLNAAVLGLSRAQTRRRFDDIVSFAEIGDFLDMPIKHYSSGMHARLGFAIAAHADPDVMLVDEVLSVGDRVFRAKCIDRMNAFLRRGVAVVFVSHDLGSVARFCRRTMVLVGGQNLFCGPSGQAIGRYHEAASVDLVRREVDGSTGAKLASLRLEDADGRETTVAEPGDNLSVTFEVLFSRSLQRPSYGLSLVRSDDRLTMFEVSSTRLGEESSSVRVGQRVRVRYDLELNVPPGQYVIGLHVRERDALHYDLECANVCPLLVTGQPSSGGVVYLRPRVRVEDADPVHTSMALLP